jgi:PKD repeat protein
MVALALLSACTLKKQETPSLTGPSTLATSVQLTVSPDTLSQDGASQSQVTIQAFDSNGQPKRNVSMRAEIMVDGTLVDFGTLSARNVVTDANGRATLIYTAPASSTNVDTFTIVKIVVTPAETDFANAAGRFVNIRLVPVGMVMPPDGMRPDFTMTPGAATDHQDVLFDASQSVWNPTNPIESFRWEFGDGDSGTGLTTTHAFDQPGTFLVTLTMTDAFGRSASKTQTITVSAGLNPTAVFTTSPSNPVPNSDIFFNAVQSRPAPGYTIRSYRWDFGDGTSASGVQVSHRYANPGSYTVTLVVTDDVGRVGTTTQGVSVTLGAPTADFTFSIAGASVTFTSAAVAAPGRSIASYAWSFGDPGSGAFNTSSAANPSHTFSATGTTYNVTLVVTDDVGKTGTITKAVTIP